MPDDHSAVEPPLPISNRTVKRCSADDSEPALVKVGHRQASKRKTPEGDPSGVFLCALDLRQVQRDDDACEEPSQEPDPRGGFRVVLNSRTTNSLMEDP